MVTCSKTNLIEKLIMKNIALVFPFLFTVIASLAQTGIDEDSIMRPEKFPHTIKEFNLLCKLAVNGNDIDIEHILSQERRETPFARKPATAKSSEMVLYRSDTSVAELLFELMRDYNVHSRDDLARVASKVPRLFIFPHESSQALVTMMVKTDVNSGNVYVKSLRFDIAFTDEDFKSAKEKLQLEAKK